MSTVAIALFSGVAWGAIFGYALARVIRKTKYIVRYVPEIVVIPYGRDKMDRKLKTSIH